MSRGGARPLDDALTQVRAWVLDEESLVKAVFAGRRKGQQPTWRRAELRWIDLKGGPHLQITTYDDTQAHTSNHPRTAAAAALDSLLTEPFGSWHIETAVAAHQIRATKRGETFVNSTVNAAARPIARGHDREKARILAEDDPVLKALGISTAEGRVKASRRAKYRQVEEFVRILDVALSDAFAAGHLRRPTTSEPLRVVDLGCGNAYLTFAAFRHLAGVRGLPVALVGVDVKEQSREHNTAVARELGIDAEFVVGTIDDVELEPPPEVVLALHACDTATDDALARAVRWRAPVILAAPCCHHDIAAQLRRTKVPTPYAMLTRHGILRERLADTLTDGIRAALLRREGYRVDVIEFVGSEHTPRNTLLRAVRTGDGQSAAEYDELVAAWGIEPRLGGLLGA